VVKYPTSKKKHDKKSKKNALQYDCYALSYILRPNPKPTPTINITPTIGYRNSIKENIVLPVALAFSKLEPAIVEVCFMTVGAKEVKTTKAITIPIIAVIICVTIFIYLFQDSPK
jgi:hypothetical protein